MGVFEVETWFCLVAAQQTIDCTMALEEVTTTVTLEEDDEFEEFEQQGKANKQNQRKTRKKPRKEQTRDQGRRRGRGSFTSPVVLFCSVLFCSVLSHELPILSDRNPHPIRSKLEFLSRVKCLACFLSPSVSRLCFTCDQIERVRSDHKERPIVREVKW